MNEAEAVRFAIQFNPPGLGMVILVLAGAFLVALGGLLVGALVRGRDDERKEERKEAPRRVSTGIEDPNTKEALDKAFEEDD